MTGANADTAPDREREHKTHASIEGQGKKDE